MLVKRITWFISFKFIKFNRWVRKITIEIASKGLFLRVSSGDNWHGIVNKFMWSLCWKLSWKVWCLWTAFIEDDVLRGSKLEIQTSQHFASFRSNNAAPLSLLRSNKFQLRLGSFQCHRACSGARQFSSKRFDDDGLPSTIYKV